MQPLRTLRPRLPRSLALHPAGVHERAVQHLNPRRRLRRHMLHRLLLLLLRPSRGATTGSPLAARASRASLRSARCRLAA